MCLNRCYTWLFQDYLLLVVYVCEAEVWWLFQDDVRTVCGFVIGLWARSLANLFSCFWVFGLVFFPVHCFQAVSEFFGLNDGSVAVATCVVTWRGNNLFKLIFTIRFLPMRFGCDLALLSSFCLQSVVQIQLHIHS
jgi:hypothetical protein